MRKIDIIKKRLQQIWDKYGNIIIVCFIMAFLIWYAFDAFQTPEDELVDKIMSQQSTGTSKRRSLVAFEKYIVSNWGKQGYIVFTILSVLMYVYILWWTIQKLRCIERRNNLIHEGKLSIWDTNFGFEKISLWRSIKNIFRRKKDKYPSEKEMRDALKNNKYYKEKDRD